MRTRERFRRPAAQSDDTVLARLNRSYSGRTLRVRQGIYERDEAYFGSGLGITSTYKDGMRVPARVYATAELLDHMEEGVFDQIANVASLPGIVDAAMCMPDGHWGYGFPIGGVAAFDPRTGIISPGGIGFDINCGMRLASTDP